MKREKFENIINSENSARKADLTDLDSFERDAIEGFEQHKNAQQGLEQLDKRMQKAFGTSGKWFWAGISVSIILLITTVLIYNNIGNDKVLKTDSKINLQSQLLYIEAGDVIEPNIQELTELKKEDLITKKDLPKTPAKNIVNDAEKTETGNFDNKIDKLPMNDNLPNIEIENAKIINTRKEAKEYYPGEFKLIDYRGTRVGNKIETKTLELNGLPANKENEYSATEEMVWKDIEIPYDEYIRKTMRYFEKGNYKKALTRYNTILETYPDDMNALFYGGLCLYNLGDFDNTILQLSKITLHPYTNFDEEALWFIALSYKKNKDDMKYKETLEMVVKLKGFYLEQARKELGRL